MSLPVHNMMTYARAQGAPWDVIDQQLATAQQAHLAAGGDFWEMTSKMGFGDPKLMRDRIKVEALMDKANG